MYPYKFCFLNHWGRIVSEYEATFSDDDAAVREAGTSGHPGKIDVWQRGHYVATVGSL